MGKYHYNVKADGNHSPCPECSTLVYWRDGPYCYQCRDLPERYCFECERTSHTAGSACHQCDKPLGRLSFGFDRLVGKQRIGGWTDKKPHPAAVWEAIAPTAWVNGTEVVTPAPVIKGYAPGIGFPEDGKDIASRKYLAGIRSGKDDIGTTTLVMCFACNKPLIGTKRGKYDRFRERIVPAEPGRWMADKNQLAHPKCPLTESERMAQDASYYMMRARRAIPATERPREPLPTMSASGTGLHLPIDSAA